MPAASNGCSAEVDQVERLLNDLRTLSNADAGVLALELEEVSLPALVGRVVALHRPAAEARGIVVEVSSAPDLSTIAADPGRLEQVVANLLDNAVRHGVGVTRVHVAIRIDAAAVVEVADDGEGMDPDRADRAFDRFAGSSDRDGTGLGLPIVRSLVERHGGTVSLTSERGRGTTVTVRLPIA